MICGIWNGAFAENDDLGTGAAKFFSRSHGESTSFPVIWMLLQRLNMQDEDTSLVLSSDAKPRLKWTPELHQRFVDAVNQIGGADKATPKSLMRVMGVPGLTLYHLKSHLQKYRLGKNLPTDTCSDSNQEDYKDSPGELDLFREERSDPSLDPIKEGLQIARAIQMQMEVQRKLHEQIEVQRHLQLRIEAQGKYLQKVLKKAQETLAGHASSSSMGAEHAQAELSQLFSMVSSGCLSSSLSELTEMRAVSLEELDRQIQLKVPGSSVESSLTSSETSGLKEDKERIMHTPVALPLLDQPQAWISSDTAARKRPRTHEDTTLGLSKFRLHEPLDLNLNSQCQSDQDLDQSPIDLNSTKIDQFNGVSLLP